MPNSNKDIVNFAGGEAAPGMVARHDIPLHKKIMARIQNFTVLTKGPIEYRAGTRHVLPTRNNAEGVFIEFQFSDAQSYLLEATDGYFRFYKDEGIIFKDDTLTITGVTQADPGVVTYTGTDPLEGEQVYISGVVGMTELNGDHYIIKNLDTGANTFELTDIFGNNIDTTGFTAYSSAGTCEIVYEVRTPYKIADIERIQFNQNADTMYLTSQKYSPRKLTRTDHDAWTLERYTRTSDPFESENDTFGTITAISQANPGVISDTGHTFQVDDYVYIEGIEGMTELNYRHFQINTTASGSYTLKDIDTGTPIDTSSYGAWTSGGIVEKYDDDKYPAAVGFTDDARLGMHGTKASPETSYYSRSPSSAGAVRFDNYDNGGGSPDDDHAVYFTLAPLQGKVDSIRWVTNTDKYIALGTFGSIRRVFGEVEAASITPSAVSAKAANADGVHPARPIVDGSTLFYISRTGKSLEAIEYDYQIDGYAPDDKNLVSDHITKPGIFRIRRQEGPGIIWALRTDGILLGLTFKAKENIAGWHRFKIGGDGIIESIGIMPRPDDEDQLWLIVRRTINGNTVRHVEFVTDHPTYPDVLDFYTNEDSEESDTTKYLNYLSEVVKDAIHLDASLTYDGKTLGVNAGANITVGTGADVEETTGVIITASAGVFTSDMVGREIWGAYDTKGDGGGRLEITNYTSATQVEGTVVDPFPAGETFNSGNWFLTATTVSGLGHLEGETVHLLTDGAVPETEVVTNGSVSTTQPASVIHVGYQYRGILKTFSLDQGGQSGPAQNKIKIVSRVILRFLNAAGIKFGTSPYSLEDIDFQFGNVVTDRPPPLFNGPSEVVYEDTHDRDKELYLIQDNPLPCTIASMDIFMETSEE